MKRLFLLAVLVFTSSHLSAQTLTANVLEDHIYDVPTVFDAYNIATVHNTSANAINIGARVDSSGILLGHQFAICFGVNCYNRGLTIAPDPQAIAASTAYSDFKLYCYPNNIAGTSNIRVTWYLWNNPNDSVDFLYKFTFGVQSTADFLAAGTTGLAAPSPNPANHTAVLTYTLPLASRNGSIEISDMSGRAVASIPVDATGNQVGVATAMWPTGIYNVVLKADGQVLGVQKLVVQH